VTTFISYSRADKEFAERLANDLRAADIDVWIDQREIRPGQAWDAEIEAALERSDDVLVILSPDSVASEHVRNEIEFALNAKKTVVPLLHRHCTIPMRLLRIQYVDFTSSYDAGFSKLTGSREESPESSFEKIDIVGRGAFGVVWEVENRFLKRREAVKIYELTGEEGEARRRRFRQGAIAQARLEHPNIAAFYGTIDSGRELQVRMQFIRGEPISDWMKKRSPSIRERVRLLAEAAETIQFAHDRGVIHRDLKPTNILVVEEKSGWRPVIVDFDTAVVVGESSITHTAELFGTFGYIDPATFGELSHTELRDPRSDVYSLGRILEFMLTGEHPRPGRSMRDLEDRVRRMTGDRLSPRELNLLLEVLLPATADRRDARTQTAAAFASDLRAIFDERIRGELDAKSYAEEVFRQLDALVAAQRLPLEWMNLPSDFRPDQIGRYSPLTRYGELDALYDEQAYSFYVGPVIADEDEFAAFARSDDFQQLRAIFGEALRLDPITQAEDGAANLVIRYFDVCKQSPEETALQFAGQLTQMLAVLEPPKGDVPPELPLPRDILGEFDDWPNRSFGARGEFKKLASAIRERGDKSLAEALLPVVHLLWPEARLVDGDGFHIAVGSTVAIHCSGHDEKEIVRGIEAFRRSASAQPVRDFIVIIDREELTVGVRKAVRLSLERLIAEGDAERVMVWNHRDHLMYAAFEMMLERVFASIDRWSAAMLEEQSRIERKIGAAPVRRVPLRKYQLRIDATALRSGREYAEVVTDVVESIARGERRQVLLGTAGFGKTTAVMRAARELALRWLVIPAARLRRDGANAQTVFETALDFDELLRGATPEERPLWQRIAGPVLKYITQIDSGLGVIVDALDESPTIPRSYGLHTFFNFFRRAKVPVIITMRSSFWEARREDFVAGKSAVESTVQTIDVVELQPWGDEQIVEAARLRLAEVSQVKARRRIEAFIDDVENGEYLRFYGDIPRTPLFLRFILDILDRRDPRDMNRRDLFRYWAEQKIARDFKVPLKKGGSRIPIRVGVTTVEETIALSFRAMTAAAECMTEVRDGVVELLPDCTFEQIRAAMGAEAPDSAESLALNSLLITMSGTEGRLRFAHRVFQEFFLGGRLPASAGDSLSS